MSELYEFNTKRENLDSAKRSPECKSLSVTQKSIKFGPERQTPEFKLNSEDRMSKRNSMKQDNTFCEN